MAGYTLETGIRNMHILQEHDEGNKTTHVNIRMIFLRIGKLDTQKETFQAHVAIEARWVLRATDDKEKIVSSLSIAEQTRLNNGETVKLPKEFAEQHWHPQLFLLNVRRDHDEETRYSMKKYISQIQIREYRDVHGEFYSKFDLHYFPTDIQELGVSIGSALFDTEVTLEMDGDRASGINREAFIDQQEWKLYDHIETRTQFMRGFLFQNDESNELDVPGHERKRSILTIACHAGRRAKYFFWNGYGLIFLITVIAFSSFSIPANGSQDRINISCTLLLTSIAFRWTISNALPRISYLTIIDTYALASIAVLILLCIWHSIIGAIVYIYDHYDSLSSQSYWSRIDQKVFFASFSLYIVVHLAMGVWHYCVPLAQRRRMKDLDQCYRQIVERNISKDQSSTRPNINYDSQDSFKT